MAKIAVIGAGLSGLVVARYCQQQHDVRVFEKSRGVGGRMATRRADPYQFDHGAQFFKVRTPAFRAFLQPLIEAGVVAPWHGRFVELTGAHMGPTRVWADDPSHYVGVPGMNALGKYLAKGLRVLTQTQIVSAAYEDGWYLCDQTQHRHGPFDWVVTTAPAPQSLALLPKDFCHHAALSAIEMLPCFSLMLGYTDMLPLSFEAALVKEADISWISVNSSKPGRSQHPTLLVHATNRWAAAHFDEDREAIAAHLLAVLHQVTSGCLPEAQHTALHGWRYANMAKSRGPRSYVDHHLRWAACGDWCVQGRVEAAFLSAQHVCDVLP